MRLRFLQSESYVSITDESGQTKEIRDAAAAVLLAYMLLGNSQDFRHLSHGLIPVKKYCTPEEIVEFFGGSKSLKDDASSTLRKECSFPNLSFRGTNKDIREIFVGAVTVDVIELLESIRTIEAEPNWNPKDVETHIEKCVQLHPATFLKAMDIKSRGALDNTKASKWFHTLRGSLHTQLEAVFDKYVVCLVAAKDLRRAKEFINTDWHQLHKQFMRNESTLIGSWRLRRLIQVELYERLQVNKVNWSIADIVMVDDFWGQSDQEEHAVLESLVNYVDTYPELFGLPTNIPEALEFGAQLYASNRTDYQSFLAAIPSKRLLIQPPVATINWNQPHKVPFTLIKSLEVKPSDIAIIASEIRTMLTDFFRAETMESIPIHYALMAPLLNTPIEDTTHQLRHRLQERNRIVIWGDAGTGKTFLLNTLAMDLLLEYEGGKRSQIPVVINLSTWNPVEHTSFDMWFVQRITTYIPKLIWEELVKNDLVIFLLDGLDQVSKDARLSLIAAIAEFVSKQTRAQFVITSRPIVQDDNRGIFDDRGFSHATIHMLNSSQIEHVIRNQGDKCIGLLSLITKGNKIADESEFLLRFIHNTHRLRLLCDWSEGKTEEEIIYSIRKDKFDLYIDWCRNSFLKVKKSGRDDIWQQRDTIVEWMLWLAKKMKFAQVTEFELDVYQKHWLPSNAQRTTITIERFLLVVCLTIISFIFTYGIGAGIQQDNWIRGEFIGELTAIAIWIAAWLPLMVTTYLFPDHNQTTVLLRNEWSWRHVPWVSWGDWKGIALGCFAGGFGVSIAILVGYINSEYFYPGNASRGGGIAIGVGSIALALSLGVIFVQRFALALFGWACVGLIAGVVFGFGVNWSADQFQIYPGFHPLGATLACGLAIGIGTSIWKVITFLLLRGLSQIRTTPSPTFLSRSFQNALRISICSSLFIGIIGLLLTVGIMWAVEQVGFVPAQTSGGVPIWIAVPFNAAVFYWLNTFVFLGALELYDMWRVKTVLNAERNGDMNHLRSILEKAETLGYVKRTGNRWRFEHEDMHDTLANINKLEEFWGMGTEPDLAGS